MTTHRITAHRELSSGSGATLDLGYFVQWHRRLWIPAVTFLIDDPRRFAGKRLLEIGCGDGRMSCLFALLGATVIGVDMPGVSLAAAQEEAARWGVQARTTFLTYDGSAENIPGSGYDYIFTKSVLVVVPGLEEFLRGLSGKLLRSGELLAAENLAGGPLLRAARLVSTYRRYKTLEHRFHGVDREFLTIVNRVFPTVSFESYYGSVAAIQALNR